MRFDVRFQQILGELPRGLGCGGDGECIDGHAQNDGICSRFHCFLAPVALRNRGRATEKGEWKVA